MQTKYQSIVHRQNLVVTTMLKANLGNFTKKKLILHLQ